MAATQGGFRWVPRKEWKKEAELEAKVRELEIKNESLEQLVENYHSVGDETIFTIKLGRYRLRFERKIY